ncbi:hypothetical protein NQX30_05215 [Candidatus Persebacteraceae bacterium Df01]|jgi:NADPH:quinone reductase-like Zn-dependent oxidoreductase|uniref:Alcohol dehydrogenase N-terminal domain-containing protein n=1 Tax=Candidatus Doriopsillibacter californiensis TaxID=2970740 RepID=A0ABT7QMC6_9GAMM|nr:hypothetical protein [Candidatus Persebacteraceae bacterium Df01]
MKAVITSDYSSVDVLEVKDIDKLEISDKEILIRIHACSVNLIDWKI